VDVQAAVERAEGPLNASSIRVAILCGGLGTRLGELTKDVPKPMIEVGGRPYLERVVESFRDAGLRDIVMLTGYRADVIENHFGDGSRFGVQITYSREDQPLGTGGALRLARPHLGERFILTFGDVLRFHDYDRFLREHATNCLAVYPRMTKGNADVREGRVTRFDKKAPELPYLDAGFSVIESRHIDLVPPHGVQSFEEIVYAELARRGQLEAEIVNHDFYDIGVPEQLARTRAALESRT
jgi:NDP-sugar pyrophosphorylase family protein